MGYVGGLRNYKLKTNNMKKLIIAILLFVSMPGYSQCYGNIEYKIITGGDIKTAKEPIAFCIAGSTIAFCIGDRVRIFTLEEHTRSTYIDEDKRVHNRYFTEENGSYPRGFCDIDITSSYPVEIMIGYPTNVNGLAYWFTDSKLNEAGKAKAKTYSSK